MSTAQILPCSPSLVGRKPGNDAPYDPLHVPPSIRPPTSTSTSHNNTTSSAGTSNRGQRRARAASDASLGQRRSSSTASGGDDKAGSGTGIPNGEGRPRSHTTPGLSSSFDLLCSAATAAASSLCSTDGVCIPCGGEANNEVVQSELEDSMHVERDDISSSSGDKRVSPIGDILANKDKDCKEGVGPIGASLEQNASLLDANDAGDAGTSTDDATPSTSAYASNTSSAPASSAPIHSPVPQHRGLHNLGNTCYLNSALQVLMTVEGFVDDVLHRTAAGLTCGVVGGYHHGDNDCERERHGSFENGHNIGRQGGGVGGVDGTAYCGGVVNCCSGSAASSGTVSPATADDKAVSTTTTDMARLDKEAATRGIVAEERRNLEGGGASTPTPALLVTADKSDKMSQSQSKDGDNAEQESNKEAQSSNRPLHEALGQIFSHLRNAPNASASGHSSNGTPNGGTPSTTPNRPPRSFSACVNGGQEVTAVNPTKLKEAVDMHAPQFVGYEQQDSHEFLGTLLDLLHDEVKAKDDGKQRQQAGSEEKDEKEEEDEKQKQACKSKHKDQNQNDDKGQDDDTTTQDLPITESSSSDLKSPCKRPRRDPTPPLLDEAENDGVKPQTTAPSRSSPPPPRNQSLTDLSVADISALLHNNKSADEADTSENTAVAAAHESTAPSSGNSVHLQPPASDNPPRKPTSPVEAHFATEIRTRLTCDSCKFGRSSIEMFRCLSLDVAANNEGAAAITTITIEEALRRFFASEKLDIKCEKCFCETATQTSEISKLPRALLLHFKRFIVDVAPNYSKVTYRKDTRQVEFSDTIALGKADSVSLADYMASNCALPPIWKASGASRSSIVSSDGADPANDMSFEDDRVYRLRGIVNHIGQSANRGHYTAVTYTGPTKSPLSVGGSDGSASGGIEAKEKDSLVWTKFNDSYVSKISAKDALGEEAQKTAYMVLYALS